jgi:N-acetylmuramoyl-L-alanine amidase
MRLASVLVLLALVAVACSSSDDSTSPTTSAPAAPSPTASPTTASPTTVDRPAPPPFPDTSALPVAPADARALRTDAGPIVPVLAHDGAAFRVRTPCGLEASVVDGTPIATVDVVLDPGHGGDEDGAVGANGLKEKDLNLAVAERARERLEAEGYRVALTRTGDYRVTLATRAELARALEARAFVSVHHNAVADGPSDGPGSETYYQIASPDSKRLAGLVYEEVVGAFDGYDVAWEADRDAGAKYRTNRDGDDYYGILRRAAGVPSVLSEAAYVSNPAEADLLADRDVQGAEGAAIARAVDRFLTSDDAGTGFVEPYPRRDEAGPGGGPTGCVDPPL